jgi:hypothetical protein
LLNLLRLDLLVVELHLFQQHLLHLLHLKNNQMKILAQTIDLFLQDYLAMDLLVDYFQFLLLAELEVYLHHHLNLQVDLLY